MSAVLWRGAGNTRRHFDVDIHLLFTGKDRYDLRVLYFHLAAGDYENT